MESQRDPGRLLALGLTTQELESFVKAGQDVADRHRIEKLQCESRQRESEWKRQLQESERRNEKLGQENKQLKGQLERVRSAAVEVHEEPNFVARLFNFTPRQAS